MKKITILTISFILCILSTSFALSRARESARTKACYSSQRVIQGAIEMYDMDHSKLLTSAYPGGEFEELEKILIQEKYLKAFIVPPEDDCSYGYITYDDSKFGDGEAYTFCLRHGSYWKKSIPDFKNTILKPFSRDYLKKRIEAKYGSLFNYYFKDIGPFFFIICSLFIVGSIIKFFIDFTAFLKKKIWGLDKTQTKKIE